MAGSQPGIMTQRRAEPPFFMLKGGVGGRIKVESTGEFVVVVVTIVSILLCSQLFHRYPQLDEAKEALRRVLSFVSLDEGRYQDILKKEKSKIGS